MGNAEFFLGEQFDGLFPTTVRQFLPPDADGRDPGGGVLGDIFLERPPEGRRFVLGKLSHPCLLLHRSPADTEIHQAGRSRYHPTTQ